MKSTVCYILNALLLSVLTSIVLNLPQVYQKPDAQILLDVLIKLRKQPRSWKLHDTSSNVSESSGTSTPREDPKQITQYLTSIVGSPLKWIQDDEVKEAVWQEASARLTERSGRTAMSAIDRTFEIPTNDVDKPIASITIHEPSLTADNLGLKTWAASYLLAQRLRRIKLPTIKKSPLELSQVPLYRSPVVSSTTSSSHNLNLNTSTSSRVDLLELGAGTGLVGIAAAIALNASVFLTDLPSIEPNLRRNIALNAETISRHGGSAISGVLDWEFPAHLKLSEIARANGYIVPHCFEVILAADTIYTASQPKLLVRTITHWLGMSKNSRVILELPRRELDTKEILSLKHEMEQAGLHMIDTEEEIGHDDWGHDTSDEDSLVHCWFSVWAWKDFPETDLPLFGLTPGQVRKMTEFLPSSKHVD
jgi:predicted nicotinamide N-methyase